MRPTVVMDVGDVLVATKPMAQYRALAHLLERPWREVADQIEGCGSVQRFERGLLTPGSFAADIRAALDRAPLTFAQIEASWNAVLGPEDLVLCRLGATLAADNRLVLASNTNPFHWKVLAERLGSRGLKASACLSFQVGALKPDPAYYDHLAAVVGSGWREAIFVDDNPGNVEQARSIGFRAVLHRDPNSTRQHLLEVAF